MKKEERNSMSGIWTEFRKMYPSVTVSQKKLDEFMHSDRYYPVSSSFAAQMFKSWLENDCN